LALNIIKNYSFYFYSFISNDNLFLIRIIFAPEVLKGEYDEK